MEEERDEGEDGTPLEQIRSDGDVGREENALNSGRQVNPFTYQQSILLKAKQLPVIAMASDCLTIKPKHLPLCPLPTTVRIRIQLCATPLGLLEKSAWLPR
jgi:hypothetical protein